MTGSGTVRGMHQDGIMLLEALVAILLFSVGILAIVGLQANSVKLAGDAKYRSDAALLATELIGKMSVADKTPATFLASFDSRQGSSGSGYSTWLDDVQTALPGISAGTAVPPVVAVTSTASGVNQVCIAIFWISPNEPTQSTVDVCNGISVSDVAHYYVASAQFK